MDLLIYSSSRDLFRRMWYRGEVLPRDVALALINLYRLRRSGGDGEEDGEKDN